jgi:integrase
MSKSDGLVPGSRLIGVLRPRWELAVRWRGRTRYVYFPECEYQALRDYKEEVDRLEAARRAAEAARAVAEADGLPDELEEPVDLDEVIDESCTDEELPDPAEFYYHTSVDAPNPISRRSTVNEAIAWYVASQRVNKSQRKKFDALVRHLGKVGEAKLARFTDKNLIAWIEHVFDEERLAVSTLESLFARLKLVTHKLLEDKRIASDPCTGVSVGAIAKELGVDATPRRLRNFEAWSIEKMVMVLGHVLDPGEAFAFVLQAFMGLRLGEAIRVRGLDIDVAKRRLEVFGTKTIAAHRILPIPLFVWEFLCAAIELIHGCTIEELTPAQLAERLCPVVGETWRRHFYELQRRIGLPESEWYWPHALRHWFGEHVDNMPTPTDRFERYISIYMGHDVSGYLRTRGASLMTFGTYIRTVRTGLEVLASLWDETVVTLAGLIHPSDPVPDGPASPAPGALTLQQVAVRIEETVSFIRNEIANKRFCTARQVPGAGRWAGRKIWVIDETEVDERVRADEEHRHLWATASELVAQYGVHRQTIMAVATYYEVEHELGRSRGKKAYLICRSEFTVAATKAELDRVVDHLIGHDAARELDCSRKEVNWLIDQGRLRVTKLAFDTRGTHWITRESLREEKLRRTRGIVLGDEQGYTSEEVASMLGCDKEAVWAMRRQGVIPVVLDADGRVVTPASVVDKIVTGTDLVVSIVDAASIIGCVGSTVYGLIREDKLHVVSVRMERGRPVRMLLRAEVNAVKEWYRAKEGTRPR